jgi:hypothetical protein
MPLSASTVVGEGRGLSPGAKAEVGEGTTSLSRLPDGLDEKLFVFQENAEVLGRDCCGSSNDGVVGCESANETEGSEFLRLG